MDVMPTARAACASAYKLPSDILAMLRAMIVVVAALAVAGQFSSLAALAEKLPNANPPQTGVTASYLRRWSKRIVEYPLNLGLPAYHSKRGPITVNARAVMVTTNGSSATSSGTTTASGSKLTGGGPGFGGGGGGTGVASPQAGSAPDISHTAGYFKLNRTHDAQ